MRAYGALSIVPTSFRPMLRARIEQTEVTCLQQVKTSRTRRAAVLAAPMTSSRIGRYSRRAALYLSTWIHLTPIRASRAPIVSIVRNRTTRSCADARILARERCYSTSPHIPRGLRILRVPCPPSYADEPWIGTILSQRAVVSSTRAILGPEDCGFSRVALGSARTRKIAAPSMASARAVVDARPGGHRIYALTPSPFALGRRTSANHF
ncbi:hypothetical protein BD414DRAFT_238281 [Trametes punicea]|nr:hypothetical protein BD414DRAFT_238281 [Trametes punicea]